MRMRARKGKIGAHMRNVRTMIPAGMTCRIQPGDEALDQACKLAFHKLFYDILTRIYICMENIT